MRVLLVVEPGLDGAFRHVEGLARHLLGVGDTVHLAYSSRRTSRGLDELVAEVRARGGLAVDLEVGNAPRPGDVRALARLRRFVGRVRPDVVHSHSSKAGALVRVLPSLGVRAPVVHTPHAYVGMDGSADAAVYWRVERLLGRVGTTITISPDEADFARTRLGIPSARVRTVHNPVDLARFVPGDAVRRAELRAEYAIPDDAVVIGSVGRLAPQKDPRTLFHSVWSVMQADPSVWFVHVGHGELAEEMTAWAESTGMSERWVHVPYLESPERIYQLFDGFVVCPIFEAGWPLVLLEALAAGLPVVTTRSPGMSDIDRAGLSHCWTASPRDVEGVARGLRHLVAAVSADATTNHRAYAAEHFDPAARYADVRAVYLEIAPSTR